MTGSTGVAERIEKQQILNIISEIEAADGNEILIIGYTDDEKKVINTEIAAHGNQISVPALKQYMHKGDVILHNHPSGNLNPSEADIDIASRLGNQGIGFYIINNSVDDIYIVAEPVLIKRVQPIDSFEILKLLKPGGRLASIFDEYEERESQIVMLETVIDSFNNNTISIIEAGTGTGKSLAYLIPVFNWILKNDERVVISTATINLQQQIMEKDMVLTAKLCGMQPGVSLVKGRGNYVCRKRYYETVEENALFSDSNDELKQIGDWIETTLAGDKTDLSFYPQDKLWADIRSEADLCTGIRCSWHEECFVLKARRKAASSRILIVNHHLLFSDLSMRSKNAGYREPAILPVFNRIIFDEAHNIEKSASSYFSESFSYLTIKRYLYRIIRKIKGKKRGLYFYIKKKFNPDKKGFQKIPVMVEKILSEAENLNNRLLVYLEGRNSILLSGLVMNSRAEDLFKQTGILENLILHFIEMWDTSFSEMPESVMGSSSVYECRVLLNRLHGIASLCDSFLHHTEKAGSIFWLEKFTTVQGKSFVKFVITPLDISPIMKETVYKQYKTVVFTSATLTVNKSFKYWKSRIGLDSDNEREVTEVSLPSPFNFEEQVLLAIPQDIPMPDKETYIEEVSGFISKLLLISGGHALVLFTSFSMLKETYTYVSNEIKDSVLNIFFQGQDDRKRLLDKFIKDQGSTLFATNSFWEGIDAPGQALELVIICRLPFSVPTDPVLMARVKAVEERGGNPFYELSLPEAVMKFRQGFGRLIRRRDDMGIVVILDSRILYKNYGRYFLNSVPSTYTITNTSPYVLDETEEFLIRMRAKKNRS